MVENIVDYQAVLADLHARKAGLEALIAGLEAHVLGQAAVEVITDGKPGVASLSIPGSVAAIHPDTFFGLSIIEAAKKYLKMARRAQHTTVIADALGKGGLKRPMESTLSTLLIRAAKGREVTKVGKAMWGLSEFYPKQPKESNGETPRKPVKPGRKRPTVKKKPAQTTIPADKKPTPTPDVQVPAGTASAVPQNGRDPLSISMLEVLQGAGKPLHAKEIAKRVTARGNETTKQIVEARLTRWVKKGAAKKTGPSMYAV